MKLYTTSKKLWFKNLFSHFFQLINEAFILTWHFGCLLYYSHIPVLICHFNIWNKFWNLNQIIACAIKGIDFRIKYYPIDVFSLILWVQTPLMSRISRPQRCKNLLFYISFNSFLSESLLEIYYNTWISQFLVWLGTESHLRTNFLQLCQVGPLTGSLESHSVTNNVYFYTENWWDFESNICCVSGTYMVKAWIRFSRS